MSDVSDDFRNAVSEWTGVPAWMLTGDTVDAVWDSARAAADWKQATAPPPPPPTTAAASYSVGQISRSTLPYLTADQINEVYRQGRLEEIGAPAPPPRNNGHHHG